MSEPLNILVIEDSNADFLMVERHLKQNGVAATCCRVDTLATLKDAIGRGKWNLVLADYSVPQLGFQESLDLIRTALPDLPVIMVTGSLSEEVAVELLKRGVCDFVLKGNLARLVPAIQRSLNEAEIDKLYKEEMKRNETRLRSLVDILQYPSETIQEFLDYVMNKTLQLTESKIGYIYRYHEDRAEFVLNSWSREVMAECTVLNPSTCYELDKTGIWGEAVRQRRSIIVNDYQAAHPLKKGYPKGHVQLLKFMTVPIFKGNSIVGVIGLANKETDYDATDILQVSLLTEVLWKTVERMQSETEREKLEEQFRQTQKMEAIGQLAGGVAHDFNNILQAIFSYSHLILAKARDNEPVKHYVEELLKASNRAADLTKSLLAFSRKQEVTLTVIDISEVIKGNEAFLRRLIREDIELKVTCTGEPLTVLADRGQIEQVFMNLVTNGRDAMPNGGMLSIETQRVTLGQDFIDTHGYGTAGVYSFFSVSDSGFGMDKETQSHIFEPFFTTKEQGKGTGLGLSMAYGIIKKHDGLITVYSEPGSGTIFKIYLPLVQASALAGEKNVQEAVSLRGGTETILVGEDDAALRRLSKNVLGHYGYQVIEAVDGQDAVDKFIEYGDSIDLVILDAIMPKKNGKMACDEMRTVRPDLQVLFVSGYAKDIFADDKALDENSVFIQKPVSPDVLLAKVREMLDKRISAGGSI
ncbi:MAG: response regulator [Desulfuromonadaceae bacterium]|nr:response regulator [Desulfuromonadaceae bacterium]